MQLIVLIVFIYAAKHAWDDARKAWRTSKSSYMRSADERFPRAPRSRRAAWALRHDAGYWAAQAAHAFPTARHGLAYGWHAGRKEQAERRAAREHVKTERLEAEAVLAPQVAGFRARQRAAREKLRAFGRRPLVNDTGGACEYCAAPDGRECDPACPYFNMDWPEVERIKREQAGQAGGNPGATAPPAGEGGGESAPAAPGDGRSWSWGLAWMPYQWPDDRKSAHRQARHASTDGRPRTVTAYPPGAAPAQRTPHISTAGSSSRPPRRPPPGTSRPTCAARTTSGRGESPSRRRAAGTARRLPAQAGSRKRSLKGSRSHQEDHPCQQEQRMSPTTACSRA